MAMRSMLVVVALVCTVTVATSPVRLLWRRRPWRGSASFVPFVGQTVYTRNVFQSDSCNPTGRVLHLHTGIATEAGL
jgi:hypothetical protein